MTNAPTPIKLFVGLGNPGPQYLATRHNAGFWWIEQIAQKLGASLSMDRSCQGFVARTTWQGQSLWLLEPQTFMNNSGQSVARLAHFYKILPDQILVAHDELDLPPGGAKIKRGGGHAGHNGLRDIHTQLGSPDYWRLRLGIGHPGDRDQVIHWVLKKPSQADRTSIEQAIDRAADAFYLLASGDMEGAMQKIHTTTAPRPHRSAPDSASHQGSEPAQAQRSNPSPAPSLAPPPTH